MLRASKSSKYFYLWSWPCCKESAMNGMLVCHDGACWWFLLLFFFFWNSFSFLMSLLRVGNWPRAWTLDEYNEITSLFTRMDIMICGVCRARWRCDLFAKRGWQFARRAWWAQVVSCHIGTIAQLVFWNRPMLDLFDLVRASHLDRSCAGWAAERYRATTGLDWVARHAFFLDNKAICFWSRYSYKYISDSWYFDDKTALL